MTKNHSFANVFFNNDYFCICTMSRGMLRYAEPDADLLFLPPESGSAELGEALRIAMSRSRQVSPDEFQRIFNSGIIQKNHGDREKVAMSLYGYKNRREMYRSMNCCSVEQVDGMIDIYPQHHKSLDGFRGISNDGPEILHIPEVVSNAELGAALREGFRRCTSEVK